MTDWLSDCVQPVLPDVLQHHIHVSSHSHLRPLWAAPASGQTSEEASAIQVQSKDLVLPYFAWSYRVLSCSIVLFSLGFLVFSWFVLLLLTLTCLAFSCLFHLVLSCFVLSCHNLLFVQSGLFRLVLLYFTLSCLTFYLVLPCLSLVSWSWLVLP